ncbi:MAG: FliM/FliN family flagellar motor switch protein [Polyangiaceae bacterium]
MNAERDSLHAGSKSLRAAPRLSDPVQPGKLKRVDLTGRERHLRGAMQAMAHVAQRFARSARRTLPFLVKRKARVVPEAVAIVDLGADRIVENGPIYELILGTPGGPAWGLMTLNTDAIGVVLEGVLGGGDSGGASGLGPDLTLAQSALVGRVTRALADDFAQAVKAEVGIGLLVEVQHSVARGDEREANFPDGLSVDCVFEGVAGGARITIAIGAEALESAARENDPPVAQAGDPRMAEALGDVPVEMVAQLGSVRLGLRRVLSLQAGQVLRLDTAVDDPVSVRVAGVTKFVGVPVISRGQLAVEIRGRHED